MMQLSSSWIWVSWGSESCEPLLGAESESWICVVLLFHCSKAQGEQDSNSLKLGVIAKLNDHFLGRAIKSSTDLG